MSHSSQNNPAPGEARCPGPSTRDIIASDAGGAPAHILEESYQFLGDQDITFDRYTSQEFFDLEMEHVWGKVWQWACREDEVPEAGDYMVYDIGDNSAIVTRTESGQVKAYVNSCLHRGTQLKPPASYGCSKELRCPFHGFSWSLEGDMVNMPCDWDFPHVDKENFKLPELKVETWGGFVFVNFDQNAGPLADYMGVMPEHFANWKLDEKFTAMHIRKKLPANWKACLEAFLESYHVVETHPQVMDTVGDANTQYDVFSDHVSRFVHLVGFPSPHIQEQRTEQNNLDMLMAEPVVDGVQSKGAGLKVPEGGRAREVYADYIQKTMGDLYQQDFSNLTVTETIDAIEYALFPNTCIFPSLMFPMIYRFRPNGNDPDSTIFDLLYLQPLPAEGERPEPAEPFDLDFSQSFHDVPGFDPGLATIYDQDTGNLEAQQKGFKASAKKAQTLGNYQEIRIRHLHQTIDKYIAKPQRSQS